MGLGSSQFNFEIFHRKNKHVSTLVLTCVIFSSFYNQGFDNLVIAGNQADTIMFVIFISNIRQILKVAI